MRKTLCGMALLAIDQRDGRRWVRSMLPPTQSACFPPLQEWIRRNADAAFEGHTLPTSGAFFDFHNSLAASNTATLGHAKKLILRLVV